MKAQEFYTPEELEKQYNVRDSRADYETKIVPNWVYRSEEARKNLNCELNISYGDSEKQKIDLFYSEKEDDPTLIFFHGGYWQRGDKSVYNFLANSFVEHNINLILVGYDLCPKISITKIVDQSREALVWIWKNSQVLKIHSNKIIVSGHSAGGHITGMMMGTDWSKISNDLPIDLIKAGIPISALNLLEPIRYTSINNALNMSQEEAKNQSPIFFPPVTNAMQLVVCGQKETKEFHRQSDIYVDAFKTVNRKIDRYNVPNADHFDEMNDLSNEDSEFFKKIKYFIQNL
jgi:arylformamidase